MAGGEMKGSRSRDTAELRRRIVELRDQDWGFREIAAEVDRDLHTVWSHYQKAMRQIPAAAVEEHQKKVASRLDEQLRRIDMAREPLEEIVFGHHVQVSNGIVVRPITGRDGSGKPVYGEPITDFEPVMKAIDRLGRLDDQEAKLLGMYPKQTIAIERPTSELDSARIALIEQARARAAERREKARGGE